MKTMKHYVENAFDMIPTIYISLPSDNLGSSAIVRAAREEFEYAPGYVSILLARPTCRGESEKFTGEIQFSGVVGTTRDSCPQLGILPLYGNRRIAGEYPY